MKKSELQAVLYNELIKRGYKVSLNYSIPLMKGVRGWQKVVIDLVLFDAYDNIVGLVYVGKVSSRRDSKYRSLHKKIFYIETKKELLTIIQEINKHMASVFFF